MKYRFTLETQYGNMVCPPFYVDNLSNDGDAALIAQGMMELWKKTHYGECLSITVYSNSWGFWEQCGYYAVN